MPVQAILFDAYGTLFDVYSISALAEKLFRGKGEPLASLWRAKQIEYTQLRTLCSMYKPFWEVTQDALLFSCKKLGLDLTLDAQHALMSQYAKLQPFPECISVLEQLKRDGFKLAILSNGNPQMLETVVKAAGMEPLFNHLLSVDSVKKYKTAPEAYQMGPDIFGVAPKNLLFVSSNGWDVCGASWFGYKTFWVNRAAAPMEELGVTPSSEGPTLEDLAAFVRQEAAHA
ncbi:haloacid dehalogenase type II [Noviherbaspirillum sp. CPCC 100848]|uniref:(S)-2-haloacid dehalogenase n=1 Tax=Noviherbaspirillum album TaxID=3080276 RepID=A0ABU6JE48_9BURK|nr:haloacid dehalogenase type II [Noviherbaspirillum sp. CPCC 100848]MEC4721731.1 haloacid dehalogenase type II [Noviherbaspirillum sp. CPCC 100848]